MQRTFLCELGAKIGAINLGRSPLSITALEELKIWRSRYHTTESAPPEYWTQVVPKLMHLTLVLMVQIPNRRHDRVARLCHAVDRLDLSHVTATIGAAELGDVLAGIAFQRKDIPIITGIGTPLFHQMVRHHVQGYHVDVPTTESILKHVMGMAMQPHYEEFVYNILTGDMVAAPMCPLYL
jgi:hypothetical protein